MLKGVWAKENFKMDGLFLSKSIINKVYRFTFLWKVFKMVPFKLQKFEKDSKAEKLVPQIM